MAELLKDVYTKKYIQNLAKKIKHYYKDFDELKFIDSIFDSSWKNLELKTRMRHIAVTLGTFLPFSYEKQLEILKPVSKEFTSYDSMFFQDYVEVYGLEDFKNSMEALAIFTIDSSSEFAIRQFILKYENETMKQMNIWAKSENEHLRRLACEGCRPRLPWGCALQKYKKDPSKVLEIIELLKNDKSKYVQKSVANNLNDISKDNPKLLIQFVKNNLGHSKDLDWICKHASRTLLKKGDVTILELFGYKELSHVNIIDFKYDSSLKIGENFNFSFDLKSEENLGKLRVEYVIYYLKANATHSKKVFMIAQNEFTKDFKSFIKKQSFKNMTTRKHYVGKHYIAVLINGKEIIKREFILNDASN